MVVITIMLYHVWIDLRTTEDNTLHGSGKALQNTKDGIQLAITKTTGKGPYKIYHSMLFLATTSVGYCYLLKKFFKMRIGEPSSPIMFTPARDFLLETPWRIIIPNPNVNSHPL
jgi:hypothetical protein